MSPKRAAAYTEKWAVGQTIYRLPDPHNCNNNRILDKRKRITPTSPFHWDEAHRLWVGYGQLWNKFGKSWSQPRLFHCRDLETEEDHV